MDLDERHKKLLKFLCGLAEDTSVHDREDKYVKQPGGRVYFSFSGNRESQDQSTVSFNKTFATEVVCSLYDARYVDLGLKSTSDLRAMVAQLADGTHEIPTLHITDEGRKLVERNFEKA